MNIDVCSAINDLVPVAFHVVELSDHEYLFIYVCSVIVAHLDLEPMYEGLSTYELYQSYTFQNLKASYRFSFRALFLHPLRTRILKVLLLMGNSQVRIRLGSAE